MELILDDRKINVIPTCLTYEVDGKEESELIIRIEGKQDRDFVFTHLIRNKLLANRRKNG